MKKLKSWFINRNFALLWFGQGISQLGDAIIEVTLPIWVGILTNSPSHVAGVVVAEVLPAILIGPIAGVLADRWNPARVMIVCDILRGGLILSLLLIPNEYLVWHIYFVGFAMSLISFFFNPSKNIAVRMVVKESQILQAQAISRSTQSAALIMGPVLGSSIIFLAGPSLGLVMDSMSFLLGAFTIVLMKLTPHAKPPKSDNFVRLMLELKNEFFAGFRFTFSDSYLVTILIISSLLSLVGNLWYALDVFFVEDSLGMGKESIGFLWASSGVGGLLGGFWVAIASKRLKTNSMLFWGLGIKGLAVMGYAMSSLFWVALIPAFLSGFGEALTSVAIGSIIMKRPPHHMLGRVTSFFDTAGQLSSLVVVVILGVLSSVFAPWQILLVSGIVITLSAGIAFFV